ncbi:MAG: hypothetical protein CMF21_00075 [Idiomarinaceae bacterium]|jgi:hypothetical protein|nr:hypothetical protein [Idiomarinaceae bacterium]MBL73172.1 hypothetical protein [Idiomarinaceae bacterium]|tara:strand:+ start:4275 stop:4604 length:330 start_codon:yes stop_codon:yes gene_type:complete
MGRKRVIAPEEASLWLSVLLNAAFDPASTALDLQRSADVQNHTEPGRDWQARHGQAELLAIASDLTQYPHDYSDTQRAELLLAWAERWVQADDWQRLQGRVRKRRQRAA